MQLMEGVLMKKSFYSQLIGLLAAALIPAFSQAATPEFSNLSEKDFENAAKEISGDLMHHSVQGAATLGSIFGFEVGLVGGTTSSPDIDKISKDRGGTSISNLYHGGILGVLTVPLGFTGELLILPKYSASDISAEMTSFAVKYTMDESLVVLPFNLAFRAFMSGSKLSFKQTGTLAAGTIENENKATGFQILASPKLPMVEPYVGIGMVSAKNTLSTSGVLLFDPSYTTAQSKDVTVSTTQFILGVTGNLLFVRLGAEYSSAFGNSSYTGKLAFGF